MIKLLTQFTFSKRNTMITGFPGYLYPPQLMRLKSIILNVNGSFDILRNQNRSFLQDHDCPKKFKKQFLIIEI